MFLDEKLLSMCENAQAEKPEDIQNLVQELIDECQNYYKARLKPGMTNKEAKTIVDRTFNLWDSFAKMASLSTDPKLQTFGEVFKKRTFKKFFSDTPELKRIYEKISR